MSCIYSGIRIVWLFFFIISIAIPVAGEDVSQEYFDTENSTPTPEPRASFWYQHDPVLSAKKYEAIDIGVQVQQVRPRDQMIIHFRDKGTHSFHSSPLGYNPESSRFEMTIDQRYHSNNNMEYYIEIFPEALPKIRIPETPETYFEIKSQSRWIKIIEPVAWALLITSPAIVAFLVSNIRKAHMKKTKEYEQKLRARRKKLTREREKHYNSYLKKMAGIRVAPTTPPPKSKPAENGKDVSKVSRSDTTPQPPYKGQTTPPPPKQDRKEIISTSSSLTSTGELKRELDEILSRPGIEGKRSPDPGTSPKPSGSSRPSPTQRLDLKTSSTDPVRPPQTKKNPSSGKPNPSIPPKRGDK